MVSRRSLLRTVALSSTAGVAGCSGLFWSDADRTETTTTQPETPTETPTATLSPTPTDATGSPTATAALSATGTPTPAGNSTSTPSVPKAREKPVFTPTDDASNEFGTSVALSDGLALVDVDGGSVFAFARASGGWHLESVLEASDDSRFAHQPVAMALIDEMAFIGAPDADPDTDEVVEIFDRADGDWNQVARLTPEVDEDEYHAFGRSVACDGETLVVGAVRRPSTMAEYSGTVFVFEGSGTDWTQRTAFESDPEVWDDLFGQRLALSGDSIVVGAPAARVNDESWAGKSFVYEYSGGSWSKAAELTAPSVDGDEKFGQTVALDDATLVVGAPDTVDERNVFVFERTDGEWENQTRVSGLGDFDYDDGPSGVALQEDTLLVGNPDESESGRVNRFDQTEDGWERTAVLAPGDPRPEDEFGTSVALTGETALVGTPTEDADRRGGGYLYSL